jgi:peptidyl-prolyl cis-trans isomerase A (cyclophilin A)
MRPIRTPLRLPLIATSLASLLAACGGGGGGGTDSSIPPTVSSSSVSATPYSQTAVVTVNGANLGNGLTVSSSGCSGMALSTTAPNVSTGTTAYYTCRVSATGAVAVNIARSSDGIVLSSASLNVPQPQVTITVNNAPGTVSGSMVFSLRPDKTPITVDNFLAYVNSGFYNGTIFHRVVPGFVIQGGGYLPSGALKTTLAPITLEVGKGLSNVQWSVAMARLSDPNTATSQFFINLVDNLALDPSSTSNGYAVFGSVSAGTAVANAIVGAPCAPAAPGSDCLPSPSMVIVSAQQTQ